MTAATRKRGKSAPQADLFNEPAANYTSNAEVVTAWTAGADLVKIFPANSDGGASYIQNLKGPLPQIRLISTGGVSLKTATDFIKPEPARTA